MNQEEAMPYSAPDAASDDSDPPEAVELQPEATAPADDAGPASLQRTKEDEQDAETLPPAPVTIVTGCLGAGTPLTSPVPKAALPDQMAKSDGDFGM